MWEGVDNHLIGTQDRVRGAWRSGILSSIPRHASSQNLCVAHVRFLFPIQYTSCEVIASKTAEEEIND